MTQQIDARTNKLVLSYADQVGRLSSKSIYNSSGLLVGTTTYTYDASDDPNYTVYKGELYKTEDQQGYERHSYDFRGRVTKTGRFLNINSIEYVTQATYDDADRMQTLTYPDNAASIKYVYDTAGNLTQVRSLSGTGTQEYFYTTTGFNALGQLLAYTNGNGVSTTNIYYGNSLRPQQIVVTSGTNMIQNLSYTYDSVANLKGITDAVNPLGAASASISGIAYDDMNRVIYLNSTARGAKSFGYSSIGNTLTNQEFGAGAYQYGAKPHAVTSANGVSYTYDACGNMITRGNQTLTYDEQNQLVKVATTNDTVSFGYDDSGGRLWRCGTNGYSVWIGGIYEVNNGKVLCHVFANGQLVATFEPLCGGTWSKVFGEDRWYAITGSIQSALAWLFQNGRGHWTYVSCNLICIIVVCFILGRKVVLKRYEMRRAFRPKILWRQAVAFLIIFSFFNNTIGEASAPIYSPVFYYYHTDNLGSSNVLTDRNGNVVQNYEYSTYGQTSYTSNNSAFPVSNRYTGQIADDETGLYYYGARYYDPQLGRFIQPDTDVSSPDDPQSLNRYSYCGNNPLNSIDPSGHDPISFLVIVIIAALVGGAVGGVVAAAEGGNIGMGILTGALSGFLVGVGIGAGGAFLPQLIGCSIREGAAIGGAVGGAVGGASSAAISGGNIGLSALIGGISGAVLGYLDGPTAESQSGQSVQLYAAHQAIDQSTQRSIGDWAEEAFLTIRWGLNNSVPDVLNQGEAAAAGGAATSATVAATSEGIGEPNGFVSCFPVIGSAWESAHYFSSGHWIMGTAYATMAVLDFSGVGEIGGLAIKGALKVLEKESGTYVLQFASGKAYIGKGLESRMLRSASRIERSTGDQVVNMAHYPAANSKAAFIREYQIMKDYGGPSRFNGSRLYNKFWSPGKFLSGK